MNRSRRRRIQDAVERYLERLEELRDDLVNELTEIRDEEEEAYENMPESMQYGEKGDQMTECIEALEDAISDLDGEPDFSGLYETCGIEG